MKEKKMDVSKQWTRLRTLGRGASGAEVFLAADDASGELFAVKSVCASGAAALRREQAVMSALCSPRVVSCIGGRGGRDGSYQIFLEFAPGGSIAEEIARTGGLDEHTVRSYAADVARGLAYLHGQSMVHGDVKARNVVIGADGRAKLADFGCAKKAGCGRIIGGTPAFMAPEVARGEEQGPAADVWALGCTVIEMASGRAPWSGMNGDALVAMHRIGYTDAVPEVPQWLSAEAKDFLGGCLARQASDRCTAAQLLEHPFLACSVVFETKLQEDVKGKWVSPKSTLDAAFWESEPDSEEELSVSDSSAERIKVLSCPTSSLPDWDSDEGFLGMCLVRQASDRCTAAQLLEHPFLACSVVFETKVQEDVKGKWVSPKSTLDAAFWESESDSEEELSVSDSSAERIKALACPASTVPDWDSDEGWIDVLSAAPTEAQVVAVAMPAVETTEPDDSIISEELDFALEYSSDSCAVNAGEADHGSVEGSRDHHCFEISVNDELAACKLLFCSSRSINTNEVDFLLAHDHALFLLILLCFSSHVFFSSPLRHVGSYLMECNF
ncbi:hypothetical protein QYE76_015781 [Lolium multiflorum]|uniref:Protein kinase domain-containing protein n=1 Tax=Lolium multiflorum TaxID=4521 RepID=A0AAD8U766_LOLMU|nr:hypothetical protein QYE76_015781 [Lolium multiflorum]